VGVWYLLATFVVIVGYSLVLVPIGLAVAVAVVVVEESSAVE
jgi:hypothetical protein